MRNAIDFFISYSSIDRDWVFHFIERLESHTISHGRTERNISVFYDDRDIEYGASITYELVNHIKAARFFLLVMSPECFESEWTQREYATALAYHKDIIPLYLRDTRRGDVKKEKPGFGFGDIRYIDFRDESKFDLNLKYVVNLLTPTSPALIFPIETLSRMFSCLAKFTDIVENAGSKESHLNRPEPTIETAYHYVLDSICWIMDSNSRPLGCAWRWRDDLLLCDESIGRVIKSRLASKQMTEILRADPDSYRNAVREVTFGVLGRLSGLSVWADCWMPAPIALQKNYSFPHGKAMVRLAAITYQGGVDGEGLKPVGSHFTLGPGGLNRKDDHGIIAPGTPLYDHSAKLIGTIVKMPNAEWSLKPFNDSRS